MGATLWHDNILQALLIGLVVQIVVSVLWVFCDGKWDSWKESSPATGESMVECDLEMETLNVAEGATIPDNPPHGLAASSSVGDDGKLGYTESQHASNTYSPRIIHPRPQCKNVIEDVKRRANVPVVVDDSHPHPVGEVLAR